MKNVIMYIFGMVVIFTACHKPTEKNYLDTQEYKLYMEYNDKVKEELLKFIYVANENYSPELAQAKRQLSKDIDDYIINNNLIFQDEPSESERLAFLDNLNIFIDTREVPQDIKENMKSYWALTFSPKWQELREDFLKVSNLDREELLTLYKDRF